MRFWFLYGAVGVVVWGMGRREWVGVSFVVCGGGEIWGVCEKDIECVYQEVVMIWVME